MTEQLLLTEGVDPQSPTSEDADEIGIKDDVLPLRDKDLPPIVREIVTSFVALLRADYTIPVAPSFTHTLPSSNGLSCASTQTHACLHLK